jgi:hypothetical protein
MSFRRYGGLNYNSRNNIVRSNYNTSNYLSVTEEIGQNPSYINFLSDISGNININGELDVSGNLHVAGDIDCSGNINLDGDLDVSGNLHVAGDIDCSGNSTAYWMFLSSGSNYTYKPYGVVPKSYVDAIGSGIHPLPLSNLISNNGPITLSGSQTIDGVPTSNGTIVLVNAQGGQKVANINNGIYIASNTGAWSRADYLTTGDDAAGTITFINNGIQYANTRWFCLSNPAIIGTDPVLWDEYDAPLKVGRGLELVTIDNAPTIEVDTSLNFINYLDNQGPDGAGTINIGKNTQNIDIGNNSIISIDGLLDVSGNVGIGTTTPIAPLSVNRNLAFSDVTANPMLGQIYATSSNGQNRLILGSYFTSGVNACAAIQASDYYNDRDNPQELLLQPLGGPVGIGNSAPVATLHVGPTSTGFNGTSSTLLISEESRTGGPMSGPTTNGGQLTITNANASLVLAHNNAATNTSATSGGTSSILFTSPGNLNSDYGYIQWFDNIPYPGRTSNESGVLVIGAENDSSVGVVGSDRISLYPCLGTGFVGINTLYPTTALDVNGTCRATLFTTTSDYRLKTNILPLLPSRTIDDLKPVEYDMSGGQGHDMGFIAHEVQEVFPFLVTGEKDGENMQSLNYTGLIALLVKEVQELKKENKSFKDRLEKLEQK